MNLTRALLCAVGLAVFMAGCKGPPTAPSKAQPAPINQVGKKGPPASAQPTQATAQIAQPLPPPAPPVFVYNPVGLRDPFEPFVKLDEKKGKSSAPRLVSPQTPLQRYSTEQLKLAGIVWGDGGKSKALIEDPQGKGYSVGVGTLVGDRGGRVARILPDRVIIEEIFKDVLGEEKKNVANMMLHKSEGEVAK